jgi:hypothetical protein
MSEKQKGGISVNTENIFPVIKKWLYSEKDIFLRELVSNATDAVTKLKRLASLGQYTEDGTPYRVDVILDKAAGTLTVADNGIGMTEEELQKDICSIALSGAVDFIQKNEGEGDGSKNGIIGHFGLGFYSAFMVSDTVEIYTRSYTGAPAVHPSTNSSGGLAPSANGDRSCAAARTTRAETAAHIFTISVFTAYENLLQCREIHCRHDITLLFEPRRVVLRAGYERSYENAFRKYAAQPGRNNSRARRRLDSILQMADMERVHGVKHHGTRFCNRLGSRSGYDSIYRAHVGIGHLQLARHPYGRIGDHLHRACVERNIRHHSHKTVGRRYRRSFRDAMKRALACPEEIFCAGCPVPREDGRLHPSFESRRNRRLFARPRTLLFTEDHAKKLYLPFQARVLRRVALTPPECTDAA